MIAGVVLAAGFSRRMGCDKLHLPVDGLPMYRKTLDLVCKTALFPRILVTNQPDIAQAGNTLGFRAVASPQAENGMGHSVAAGAAALDAACAGAMFLSCDQPFLTIDALQLLCEAFKRSRKIIVPTVDGVPAAPCIFPFRFFDSLTQLTGACGGKAIYRAHPKETVFVPVPDGTIFRDLDDRMQYQQAVEDRNKSD